MTGPGVGGLLRSTPCFKNSPLIQESATLQISPQSTVSDLFMAITGSWAPWKVPRRRRHESVSRFHRLEAWRPGVLGIQQSGQKSTVAHPKLPTPEKCPRAFWDGAQHPSALRNGASPATAPMVPYHRCPHGRRLVWTHRYSVARSPPTRAIAMG